MSVEKIRRVYGFIRCIPKTIVFNFNYFPFLKAIKFPVIVSHRTSFLSLKGRVLISSDAKLAKIKLGFGRVQIADNKYSRFIWNLNSNGTITIGNNVKLGTGCRLDVSGDLVINDGCIFSGESTIVCNKKITFGKCCLVSWQTLFMDGDLHKITNDKNEVINENREIKISDRVWVGARSSIMKGVSVGRNSVVANSSVVVSSFEGNSVIGGNPSRVIGDFTNKKFIR